MQKHCIFVIGGHFADWVMHFHGKIQYNSRFLRRKWDDIVLPTHYIIITIPEVLRPSDPEYPRKVLYYPVQMMVPCPTVSHYNIVLIPEVQRPPDPVNPRKVLCYPVQMMVPCPRLPTVEMLQEKEFHMLKFNGEVLKINSSHFYKLVGIQYL